MGVCVSLPGRCQVALPPATVQGALICSSVCPPASSTQAPDGRTMSLVWGGGLSGLGQASPSDGGGVCAAGALLLRTTSPLPSHRHTVTQTDRQADTDRHTGTQIQTQTHTDTQPDTQSRSPPAGAPCAGGELYQQHLPSLPSRS